MELKEFILIFKKNIRIFFWTIIIFVIFGLFFYILQPDNYEVVFPINITHNEGEKAQDYQYDQYYRLEADSKFADTVVSWINSAWFQSKIKEKIGSKVNIDAEKMSSQYIEISSVIDSKKNAKELTNVTFYFLNQEISNLNQNGESYWFQISKNEPFIESNKKNIELILIISFLTGSFFGLWGVFIKHYFEDN